MDLVEDRLLRIENKVKELDSLRKRIWKKIIGN